MADTLKPIPSHGKSLDELLADAKATLGRADQFANEQAGAVRARQAEEIAAQSLTPKGTIKRYGAPIKHALDIASIPASILPSPLQPAAAAYQLAEQGARTAEDPSLANAGMLALSALPAMQSLRKMTGLKDFFQPEAAAAERAVLRKTFGNRLAKEAQYKLPRDMGSPAEGPRTIFSPGNPASSAKVDTALPNLARSFRGETNPIGGMSSNDLLMNPDGLAWMEKEAAANGPIFQKMAREGQFGARNIPSRPESVTALEQATGRASNRGLTPAHEKALGNDAGWQDVPLDTPPEVTRVPRGASGDEFAGVQPYGPETQLTPEEAAAADEFWTQLMHSFGTR